MILPAVVAGGMLAFTLSLDDFVVSFFTTGPGSTTLPILIYSSVKRGITPDINALSTLIVLVSIVGTVAGLLFQRPRDARPETTDTPEASTRRQLLVALVAASPFALLAGCAKKETPPAAAGSEPAPLAAGRAVRAQPLHLERVHRPGDRQRLREGVLAARSRSISTRTTRSMMAKLQGGGTSLYDIVVPGQYLIPVMVKLNLLAELRHAQHPQPRQSRRQVRQPGLRSGQQVLGRLPVGHGRHLPAQEAGQGGRRNLGPAVRQGEAVRLVPAHGLGARDDRLASRRYQGKSVNTTNPDELRAQIAVLGDAKKRSQGFEGGVGGKNKVLGKAVDAAVVYNGDAVRGMADDAGDQLLRAARRAA